MIVRSILYSAGQPGLIANFDYFNDYKDTINWLRSQKQSAERNRAILALDKGNLVKEPNPSSMLSEENIRKFLRYLRCAYVIATKAKDKKFVTQIASQILIVKYILREEPGPIFWEKRHAEAEEIIAKDQLLKQHLETIEGA